MPGHKGLGAESVKPLCYPWKAREEPLPSPARTLNLALGGNSLGSVVLFSLHSLSGKDG